MQARQEVAKVKAYRAWMKLSSWVTEDILSKAGLKANIYWALPLY